MRRSLLLRILNQGAAVVDGSILKFPGGGAAYAPTRSALEAGLNNCCTTCCCGDCCCRCCDSCSSKQHPWMAIRGNDQSSRGTIPRRLVDLSTPLDTPLPPSSSSLHVSRPPFVTAGLGSLLCCIKHTTWGFLSLTDSCTPIKRAARCAAGDMDDAVSVFFPGGCPSLDLSSRGRRIPGRCRETRDLIKQGGRREFFSSC